MLLIDYVHELGAKIGLSEEETERMWFDDCDGDLEALINAMAVECCAIIFTNQLLKYTRDPQTVKEDKSNDGRI